GFVEEHDAAAVLHRQAARLALLGLEERREPAGERAVLLLARSAAHAFERALEALLVDRLEEVIERLDVERADRVFVVRGDEDDHRHRLDPDLLDDVEAAEAGHLDVEEDEVGLEAP